MRGTGDPHRERSARDDGDTQSSADDQRREELVGDGIEDGELCFEHVSLTDDEQRYSGSTNGERQLLF